MQTVVETLVAEPVVDICFSCAYDAQFQKHGAKFDTKAFTADFIQSLSKTESEIIGCKSCRMYVRYVPKTDGRFGEERLYQI